jgi:hypothetical protein
MSARKPANRRSARTFETEPDHDEGLAEIMRLTDYLGDARRAAIALVEKHGFADAIELVDGLIAECGRNDSPHATEMGAMWMMVRQHIADGFDPSDQPGTPPKEGS